jgi:hypothetical protein
MTGDGTNDAPRWLKPMSEVAMNTGTSAAREAVALDRDRLTRQAAQAQSSCGRWAVTPAPVNGVKPPPTTA